MSALSTLESPVREHELTEEAIDALAEKLLHRIKEDHDYHAHLFKIDAETHYNHHTRLSRWFSVIDDVSLAIGKTVVWGAIAAVAYAAAIGERIVGWLK